MLRGNHDQWAVERQPDHLTTAETEWPRRLPLRAENTQALALHTNHEANSELVFF